VDEEVQEALFVLFLDPIMYSSTLYSTIAPSKRTILLFDGSRSMNSSCHQSIIP